MRRALILIAFVVSAGCISPFPSEDAPLDPAHKAYLTPNFELVKTDPTEGAVATGDFYAAWVAGDDYASWETPAMTEDVLVHDLHAFLAIRVTGPVVENPYFSADIMVYGGGGGAWTAFGATSTDSVLQPNRLYQYEVDVEVPEGGLWVQAGERLGIKVVPLMIHQDDRTEITIVTGPKSSSVTWTQVPLGDAPRPIRTGADAAELVGSAYAGGAAPESTSHGIPIFIPADARAFLAWMNVTSNEGVPDVDLSLVGPDGTVIAFSGTPTPRESLKLAAPNLPVGGNYTLVATSYGSARAQVALQWALG